jgi:hypothetical protein
MILLLVLISPKQGLELLIESNPGLELKVIDAKKRHSGSV